MRQNSGGERMEVEGWKWEGGEQVILKRGIPEIFSKMRQNPHNPTTRSRRDFCYYQLITPATVVARVQVSALFIIFLSGREMAIIASSRQALRN